MISAPWDMSSVKTDAIVLRYANYGENDRMLTLLSPSMGLVSVSAKGCRKATSKTLAAAELFTAGEYLLHQKGERYTLSSFQLQESFYPIRNDVDKLAHGIYWLNLCEAATQPCEDCSRLFKMLLLSLAVLAYGDLPVRALTAVFLAQFSMLQGFAPRLDVCGRCGKPLGGALRFDAEQGGVCCSTCTHRGEALSMETLYWMQEAQAKGAFVLAGRRELPNAAKDAVYEEAFFHFRKHVENRIDKRFTSERFL